MRRAEVDEIAARVLSVTLRDVSFDAISIEERENHAGEEALFITIRFRPGSGVIPGSATGSALVELRSEFEKIGEYRFPYLQYDYPDDSPPFADAAE